MSPRFDTGLAAIGTALICFSLSACASGSGSDDPTTRASAPKLMSELADHHHEIKTASRRAQRYFDQGLVLTFGFNHDAAVRAFEEASRLDPDCAMCFWGIGLALGPNINAPMGPEAARRAFAATQEARRLAPGASPRERAYIDALATRYIAEPQEDRAALDLAYAEAMRELRLAGPDDLDAAVLAAEALMDLSPWNYWTEEAEPREHTEELLALLVSVLERNPQHVGANHYYIHAVEEHFPERAVPSAERLGDLVPEAGHLVHMPSHIFWRVGRYDDALEINRRAAAADEAFFAWCKPGAFYRALYYPHNVHFLWAAAAAEGRSEVALSAARKLSASVSDKLVEMDFLQEFVSVPALTLARFGRWDAILGEPRPDPDHRYLTGIWHYTRGLALLRTGDAGGAAIELRELRAVAEEPAAEALALSGGVATARKLLSIGGDHLEGEIAAASGQTRAALEALGAAVEKQDSLAYMEPPPWYFPVRQALGAVLLDAARPGEAEVVYREDLEQYPSNGWSLYGLSRSLAAQDREADAQWAQRGFQNAWARADVQLNASRF